MDRRFSMSSKSRLTERDVERFVVTVTATEVADHRRLPAAAFAAQQRTAIASEPGQALRALGREREPVHDHANRAGAARAETLAQR